MYPVRTLKGRFMALVMLMMLTGCFEPEHMKTVSWNNHGIELSVVNGGATSPFRWMIHYRKWSGRKLIFQSISTPYIEDIAVNGDNLLIYCTDGRFLHIHLDKIEEFIDHPVKYRKLVLEQTNASYHEPGFIIEERKNSIK